MLGRKRIERLKDSRLPIAVPTPAIAIFDWRKTKRSKKRKREEKKTTESKKEEKKTRTFGMFYGKSIAEEKLPNRYRKTNNISLLDAFGEKKHTRTHSKRTVARTYDFWLVAFLLHHRWLRQQEMSGSAPFHLDCIEKMTLGFFSFTLHSFNSLQTCAEDSNNKNAQGGIRKEIDREGKMKCSLHMPQTHRRFSLLPLHSFSWLWEFCDDFAWAT